MNKHNLFKDLKIDPEVFMTFISKIQDSYNPSFIEYHNKTHGADVCQTSNYFVQGWDLVSVCDLSNLELASIYIAGACHDFEHPGVNNAFLVESRLEWAIEYNDKSPLENHHISATFKAMQTSDWNIFKNLTNAEFKDARKTMIELVLATDAALHFTDLAKFKSRVTAEDFSPEKDDKITILKMMIHLADISNPVKSFDLALIWTGLLYDEFFKQGDQELQAGRDWSFLMNRKTTNIAGWSIGFINMIVAPAFEELAKVIPLSQTCIDNLNSNKNKWDELKDEFKSRMENDENYIPESRGKIKDKEAGSPSTIKSKNSFQAAK